jgi:uncharacterized metal-binding protein
MFWPLGKEITMTKSKREIAVSCATCDVENGQKICIRDGGKGGKGCPTLTRQKVLKEANKRYDLPEVREFARQASIQEAECYANRHQRPYVPQPSKPRIVEICEFAKKMGYKRLGLAFCAGLNMEAEIVADILNAHGFDVVSVVCKAGRTLKEKIGLKDEEKIVQGTDESMCNPIYQAKLLNHEGAELNIVLGLCVGHDSLFFKYSDAPTTVLAAKDRVTGHNPLAAIYLSEHYYRKVKHPELF